MRDSSSISGCHPRRFLATFTKYPTHIKQIEAEQAAFCVWEQVQRRRRFLHKIGQLWPVGLGLALGLIAPQLWTLMVRFEPWGMGLVFPFALLAKRREFLPACAIVHNLPLLILYLQFPIEGLIARLALRRRVTVSGVARQVFYLHYLAAIQLLMIGGAFAQALVWLS